jgi:hypothetical protein
MIDREQQIEPFTTKPHVCSTCGSEDFHVNMMWVNDGQYWEPDPDCPAWCRECDDHCHIQYKEPKETTA